MVDGNSMIRYSANLKKKIIMVMIGEGEAKVEVMMSEAQTNGLFLLFGRQMNFTSNGQTFCVTMHCLARKVVIELEEKEGELMMKKWGA